MREYIITVAAAAVAAAVADIFAPKDWSKYIRIAVGFLILSVILVPVTKFRDTKILSPTGTYNVSDEPLKNKVSEQLRQNIERDIKERLNEEYGVEAEVTVEIDANENGDIKGVKAIEVRAWKNPDGMLERLKNIYGCDRIEFKFE